MNILKKTDIQRLKEIINSVKVANNSDVVLITNAEDQVKMFEEMIPGIKVLYSGLAELYDKVYIIPTDKPIKFIYTD